MARRPVPGTRERILESAARLFYGRGVQAVGTAEVIADAGTGKSLLYRHFPTKADLVTAYLGRVRQLRAADAAQALASAGSSPRERLLALVGEVADTVQQPAFHGCAVRSYLTEFPGSSTKNGPGRVAHEFLRETRSNLDGLVGELSVAAPDALAEELWLLVDGLYMQAVYRSPDELARGARAARALAERLLDDHGAERNSPHDSRPPRRAARPESLQA